MTKTWSSCQSINFTNLKMAIDSSPNQCESALPSYIHSTNSYVQAHFVENCLNISSRGCYTDSKKTPIAVFLIYKCIHKEAANCVAKIDSCSFHRQGKLFLNQDPLESAFNNSFIRLPCFQY